MLHYLRRLALGGLLLVGPALALAQPPRLPSDQAQETVDQLFDALGWHTQAEWRIVCTEPVRLPCPAAVRPGGALDPFIHCMATTVPAPPRCDPVVGQWTPERLVTLLCTADGTVCWIVGPGTAGRPD
jgi:hypothetical protein